jgi:hypothetical protein
VSAAPRLRPRVFCALANGRVHPGSDWRRRGDSNADRGNSAPARTACADEPPPLDQRLMPFRDSQMTQERPRLRLARGVTARGAHGRL